MTRNYDGLSKVAFTYLSTLKAAVISSVTSLQ